MWVESAGGNEAESVGSGLGRRGWAGRLGRMVHRGERQAVELADEGLLFTGALDRGLKGSAMDSADCHAVRAAGRSAVALSDV